MQRSVVQAKQDSQEQRSKGDCLTFRGPHVVLEDHKPELQKLEGSVDSEIFLDKKLARHIAGMISKRTDINIDTQNGDITYVGIREAEENHPKFVLVRFQEQSMRDAIWQKRKVAKKNGIIIEEWLTDSRARLYKKCKELKSKKLIKDVITENGDVYAVLMPVVVLSDSAGKNTIASEDEQGDIIPLEEEKNECEDVPNQVPATKKVIDKIKVIVISDADYDDLVKLTRK